MGRNGSTQTEKLDGMKVEVKNGIMVLSIPISNKPVKSSTGKSLLVFSTHGFTAIDEYRVSLNVIK